MSKFDQISSKQWSDQSNTHLLYFLRVLHLGQEVSSARLGDGSEVLHEILASHAHARVDDVQQALLGLSLDADAQVRVCVQDLAVRQRQQPDLIQRVRAVRDQLTQENLDKKATLTNKKQKNIFLQRWIRIEQQSASPARTPHLLVPVERVDDELHHAVDLGLERELLRALSHLAHLRHAQLVRRDGLLLAQHRLRVWLFRVLIFILLFHLQREAVYSLSRYFCPK